MMGVKRRWVEDEGHASVLLDCLGEMRTRGSPVLGKFVEVATAKSALALIVVNGGN